MDWIHIEFEDGSNPYICKTEEEFLRMYTKYHDRIEKIKDRFYLIRKEKTTENIKETTWKNSVTNRRGCATNCQFLPNYKNPTNNKAQLPQTNKNLIWCQYKATQQVTNALKN